MSIRRWSGEHASTLFPWAPPSNSGALEWCQPPSCPSTTHASHGMAWPLARPGMDVSCLGRSLHSHGPRSHQLGCICMASAFVYLGPQCERATSSRRSSSESQGEPRLLALIACLFLFAVSFTHRTLSNRQTAGGGGRAREGDNVMDYGPVRLPLNLA